MFDLTAHFIHSERHEHFPSFLSFLNSQNSNQSPVLEEENQVLIAIKISLFFFSFSFFSCILFDAMFTPGSANVC